MVKGKNLKRKILLFVTIFLLVMNISLVKAESNVITDESQLLSATKLGGTYEIDGTIILNSPLSIEKDLELQGSGTIKLSDDWKGSNTPITVKSTLTLSGVTIDGNKDNVTLKTKNSGLIDVYGGNLIMNSGSIHNCLIDVDEYNGVVYLHNNGKFTMNDGKITNNEVNAYNGKGGAVHIEVSVKNEENIFTMNDGEISNTIRSSAIFVGGDCNTGNYAHSAKFIMNGGTICDNNSKPKSVNGSVDYFGSTSSWYAGAIYCVNGQVELNGGTIKNNQSLFYGGAIALVADASTDDSFVMKGGTITNNRSPYGGAIFVSGIQNNSYTIDVLLQGGNISNNIATAQGGGIYVTKGQTITLKNVSIYENSASILGGGVWACSTGNLKTYITNGGAIFNNKTREGTGGAGDDLAFVKHSDDEMDIRLSNRILGGGKVSYYKDGGIIASGYGSDSGGDYYRGVSDKSDRYDANNPGEAITDFTVNNNYALKSVITNDAKDLANSLSKLKIYGNSSNRGGAIGSNGMVIIGEEDDYNLVINKKWSDNTPNDKKNDIKVAVYNNNYLIEDEIILNKNALFKKNVAEIIIIK